MLWRGRAKGRRRREPRVTAGMDGETQRLVLDVILRKHPILLTFPALARELYENPDGLVAGVALARAVRDLVAEGLLYRDGHFVLPSPPALYVKRLHEWGRPAWH